MLVRCGDDAHVPRSRFRWSPRVRSAVPQETRRTFGLRAQAHVADFIEEKRPAVSLLKLADLIFRRAGKAPLNVPEKLGFDQLFRNRRAIDFHERALAAKTRSMQRASKRVPCPCRSHRRSVRGPLVGAVTANLLAQRFHRNAIADKPGSGNPVRFAAVGFSSSRRRRLNGVAGPER